ncbi:D-Ala-D-Ala dipeptidase [Tricharina praecox]|uniref:D-Ala-D-Ala dipeptidase n=1 Tax=Tricharina praecox TaxID=43433 RepID=UPI00221F2156|nr:D-Ala-D-Ala dipeptidase [Tricharina praecox]KAI5855528.1 D-Ala-D-Ala dipeptidase [Tricharina praecox]
MTMLPRLLITVLVILITSAFSSKLPSAFVELSCIDRTILREIRYTTPHNFIGHPIPGVVDPVCLLTLPAAHALSAAQRLLVPQGYSLKVYDCYRPQRAVDAFVSWAANLSDTLMRDEFYPRVDKAQLFADTYMTPTSGHSRGSTVDITIVALPVVPTREFIPGEKLLHCTAPKEQRFPDNSVDMGTGFDCFDRLSWPDDERIVGLQRVNRDLLRRTLESVGFVATETEWWHFTYQPEIFPGTFFNFDVTWEAVEKVCAEGGGRRDDVFRANEL